MKSNVCWTSTLIWNSAMSDVTIRTPRHHWAASSSGTAEVSWWKDSGWCIGGLGTQPWYSGIYNPPLIVRCWGVNKRLDWCQKKQRFWQWHKLALTPVLVDFLKGRIYHRTRKIPRSANSLHPLQVGYVGLQLGLVFVLQVPRRAILHKIATGPQLAGCKRRVDMGDIFW